MTPQQAINRIRLMMEAIEDACGLPEGDWEALRQAEEALKKQIPMKMPGTYTDYKCAICGRRIRSGKGISSFKRRDNFCQRCGQAIDWTEDEG